MELRLVDFDYCPDLSIFKKGTKVCLVATPVSLDNLQQCHRLATVPQGQHFTYRGSLNFHMASYSLLKVEVEQEGKFPTLCESADSITMCYPHCTWQQSNDLIEYCAGMGALGQGALAAQFIPRVAVELRPQLAKLYEQNCDAKVITGDITHFETLRQVYLAHPFSATMAAGVSCQPYSLLGDGRSGQDERASTLPATLAAAHFLRAVVIILECVAPASEDPYVRWQLTQFCERTGFHKNEIILSLQDVWPSKRQRWWCVLTAPALGKVPLKGFPQLLDLVSVKHVMPSIREWPQDEEQQLRLTPTEIEAFGQSSGTPASYCINMQGVMPCALHAWGSQTTACPCGCRASGLAASRLATRGLYGVLAVSQSGGTSVEGGKSYRHLHPREAALLCGLDPGLNMHSSMRLILGAVGQLASPLQSLWIMLQVRQSLQLAKCGQVNVSLCNTFHLYRSWLLARAIYVWEGPDEFHATPTLEQALRWKIINQLPIQQLVTPDRSLEQCFEQIDTIAHQHATSATARETETGISGLTATQIAIPSPSDGGTEDEEAATPVANTTGSDQDSEDFELVEMPPVTPDSEGMCAVTIHWPGEPMSIVRVPLGTSIQDLITAEQEFIQQDVNMLRFTDFYGHPIPDDFCVQANTEWVAHCVPARKHCTRSLQSPERPTDECRFDSPLTRVQGNGFLSLISPKVSAREQVESLRAQKISAKHREVMLTNQGLIWGDDEVLWHLARVAAECDHQLFDKRKMIIPIDPLFTEGWIHKDSEEEIQEWHQHMKSPTCMITVILYFSHWIPVVVSIQGDGDAKTLVLSFQQSFDTDHGIVQLLGKKLQQGLLCSSMQIVPSVHQSDIQCCGAAAIMFLEEFLLLQGTPEKVCMTEIHQTYRDQFRAQLAEEVLAPHPWMWGAGQDDNQKAVESLMAVLKDHGVPKDCLQSRAQQAVTAIGANAVSQACSSKAPWRNLKALGTNVQFKFVLPSELQQQIANRAGQDAVGKPPRKSKGSKTVKQEEPLALDPAKLCLPEGLFSSGGQPVEQLSLQQVGPVAEGVAIVTSLEAEPFLKAGKLIAQGPLALLVLNAPSAKISTALPATPVTVPARCVLNQEPLLIEATLIQLGGHQVEKSQPNSCLELESVKVSTLKLVVYRDELSGQWDQFMQGPVKYIIHHIPILKLCGEAHCKCKAWHNEEKEAVQSSVIDVWRRQFLRKGYRPEPSMSAIMFSVCLRVPECIRDRVLAFSGVAGIYAEPRSLDAREVDTSFEVVWVPRADRALVMHLKQTNPAATSIARSDDRWGLRTVAAQAQSLHASIRPDAVYLSQGPRLKFTIGPVPYGTDRRSLSRALKSFGWDVKPIQPTGAVDGGRGNVWMVHSTEQPPNNILNLGHGEMVIATVDTKTGVKDDHMKPVATQSTLTLCGSSDRAVPAKDPWVIKDPWQSYQPTMGDNSWAKSVPDSTESMKQLETKIEQSILAKMPAHQASPMEQDDVPDRVDVLEKQVQTLIHKQQLLETTVQDQHIHQSAQLTQLQGQINAQGQQVTSQLTSQQQQMQQMFEAQMNQIRTLLSKRPREDGE